MNKETINKCIENAISRIENQKNRMPAYSYISYFARRNKLTFDECEYVREQVSTYIDENSNRLFPINFTINGVAC